MPIELGMRVSRSGLLMIALSLSACDAGTTAPDASKRDAGREDAGQDAALASADGLEVRTDKGRVHGSLEGAVRVFMGIPYAAPPTAEKRWLAPQPTAAWRDTREATKAGAFCTQPNSLSGAVEGDEDCLYLNVFAPERPKAPVPVMVWFHGGAYVFGQGSDPLYKGNHLVEKGGVIVVTMNYRLGPLGFLAHSELSKADPDHVSGNYGQLDQRAALRWVQKNIAAFGGDSNNVTIFGESAGGHSVCWHLADEASRPLFHKAIIESGYCTGPASTLAKAEAQAPRFAAKLGCDPKDELACLRSKSATELVAAASILSPEPGGVFYIPRDQAFSFEPIVGGSALKDQLPGLLASGQVANVPVLGGANTHEGHLFHLGGILGTIAVNTPQEYEAALTRRFTSAGAAAIMAKYPASDYASPNDALADVTGDAFFVCQARKLARLLAASAVKNYLFSFGMPPSGVPLPALSGKAFHSAELPFVFGTSSTLGGLSEKEQPVAEALQDYYLRFAHTGDPNADGAVSWPAYTEQDDNVLKIVEPMTVQSGYKRERCDFWDALFAAG